MELGDLLNTHVEMTFHIASEIYRRFNINDLNQLNEIKSAITNYFFNETHQKQYNTVANAAVFYVLKKENPLLSFSYFHDKFKVDAKSLKSCVEQIQKIETTE